VMAGDTRFVALAEAAPDLPGSLKAVLELPDGLARARRAADGKPGEHDISEIVFLPPIEEPNAIWALALNFKLHIQETGLTTSDKYPHLFMRHAGSLVGHGQALRCPPFEVSYEHDYEGELAVVIGRTATRVSKEDAHRYVAGVTILNDLTARDLQWVMLGKNRIVDWLSSKALDKSTPVGPGLVPVKAVGDIHKLKLKTWLNDDLMQDGETSMMVFSTYELIEYLSARVTLRPGDVISTGTPFGVGGFRNIFLKAGDVLKVEIEGIGRIENPVIQA